MTKLKPFFITFLFIVIIFIIIFAATNVNDSVNVQLPDISLPETPVANNDDNTPIINENNIITDTIVVHLSYPDSVSMDDIEEALLEAQEDAFYYYQNQ